MSKDETENLDAQCRTAPVSSRGQERYARILESATKLFLEDGYAETSIDRILELAGGSKATLYSYFPTKDDLFRAVIDAVVSNRLQPELDVLDDIRTTLIEYSAKRLGVIFSDQHRALLRVVIAERQKFPDLAREYYERGPKRSRELLVAYMGKLGREQILAIDDAEQAVEFFIGMLLHEWYIEFLLLGAEPRSDAEARARAQRVVDRFLRAYASEG